MAAGGAADAGAKGTLEVYSVKSEGTVAKNRIARYDQFFFLGAKRNKKIICSIFLKKRQKEFEVYIPVYTCLTNFMHPKQFCTEKIAIKSCDVRESNPGQLLGRQLCSPLYQHRSDAKRRDFISLR